MKFFKGIGSITSLCLFIIAFTSCEKANVEFGESTLAADPNITFLDSYPVDIATFKPDSFITSSNQLLAIGYHTDPVFGVVKAGSYVQLQLPETNPLLNQTLALTFDSLEMIIKPSGAFYGDSARPMQVRVYRLTQNIIDVATSGDTYYNSNTFSYDPAPIGQQTISLYGKAGTPVHIRLSDVLGQELLTKFKDNDVDISSTAHFLDYFKGLYISTDSVITNSLAYFNAPADSMLIRLNYHDNGLYPEKKYIDLTYVKEKQFNNLQFRHTSPDFSAFINKKTQVIPASSSGNRSFLNTNLVSYIKMSFPTILNLKELHPYIRVVKAALIIKPDPSSYTSPYQLPQTLNLYTTDESNYKGSAFYAGSSTDAPLQDGDLYIDLLYGKDTNYSFDISTYINSLIAAGQFSKSALFLYPTSSFGTGVQRLVLNNSSVQLKLYVLGL